MILRVVKLAHGGYFQQIGIGAGREARQVEGGLDRQDVADGQAGFVLLEAGYCHAQASHARPGFGDHLDVFLAQRGFHAHAVVVVDLVFFGGDQQLPVAVGLSFQK